MIGRSPRGPSALFAVGQGRSREDRVGNHRQQWCDCCRACAPAHAAVAVQSGRLSRDRSQTSATWPRRQIVAIPPLDRILSQSGRRRGGYPRHPRQAANQSQAVAKRSGLIGMLAARGIGPFTTVRPPSATCSVWDRKFEQFGCTIDWAASEGPH